MTTTGRSRGIQHLEDLPVKEFQNALNRISEYEITEKVDGSEILFGIDEHGFYTSRETHGGIRIYNVADYGLTFPNTYKRSAHTALENVLAQMQNAGLSIGDQVEAEVLYGEVPNVVTYSADTSYIIFLRTTSGNVDIDALTQELHGRSLTISLPIPFSLDGRTIDIQLETHTWEFSRTPVIPNTIPAYISTLRNPVDVKTTILDKFVRQTRSAFGPEDGWIEGIVLHNPVTGHRFKVVDKDVFLAEKNFQWKHRDELAEYPRSPKYVNSLLGKMLISMAEVLDEVLGTIQAKRYLRTIGKTTNERIAFLTADMDFTFIQHLWIVQLAAAKFRLGLRLDKYKKEIEESRIMNQGLSEISIKRTKELFAAMFKQIETFERDISAASTNEQLILIFLGKQLNDLENENK